MVKIGLDFPRPDRNDYMRFVEDLSHELNEKLPSSVGCLLYGSYVVGLARYGQSSIDILFTFPGSVVIDKSELRTASDIVGRVRRVKHVPFNPVVTDSATMRDGRFNPFSPRYAGYFDKECRLISGEDYRGLFRFETCDHTEQDALRRTLVLSRRTLLLHDYYLGNGAEILPLDKSLYIEYLNSFDRALEEISRSSERIISMADGGFRYHDRFAGIDLIPKYFSDINVTPLSMIQNLFTDTRKLDSLYRDTKMMRSVLESSVDFLESLIEAFIRKKPNDELPPF